MIFILNNKIEVERIMVFLCGPNFNENNKSDRRKILRDFLNAKFKERILPLIIDDFLTPENIDDSSINVQLLEEIFAAISYKTYIFLDTISAATELGLFANNSFKHRIQVFLPHLTDIMEKNNVGGFVKDIVLMHNYDRIDLLYYRPKIIRRPIASDYVREHYGFINDILPKNISDSILTDELHKNKNVKGLGFQDSLEIPDEINKVNFTINGNKIRFFVSLRLLFYITTAITYHFHREELSKKIKSSFTESEIEIIKDTINQTFIQTLKRYQFRNFKNICEILFETKLNQSFEEILSHILKFISVYHKYSRYHGYHIIKNAKKLIEELEINSNDLNPIEYFKLDDSDLALIKDIKKNQNRYFETIIIKKNRKIRELVKYSANSHGRDIRNLHEKILDQLEKFHVFSDSSYAYRKGYSIIKCVEIHKNSNSFVKYDIKNFFNSINIEDMCMMIACVNKMHKTYLSHLNRIIEVCFYNRTLPLGLVTSPILSDIFLKNFDFEINDMLKELNLDIKYTRYADDILFSKNSEFTINELRQIENGLRMSLNKIKLKINMSKKRVLDLKCKGDHFKILGLNIIKGENENIITVGKKYINNIAKEYINYTKLPDETEKERIHKYYTGNRIFGKISFVRQVEGENGIKKIINRIDKSSHGEIDLSEISMCLNSGE